jgi:hypothetical protein
MRIWPGRLRQTEASRADRAQEVYVSPLFRAGGWEPQRKSAELCAQTKPPGSGLQLALGLLDEPVSFEVPRHTTRRSSRVPRRCTGLGLRTTSQEVRSLGGRRLDTR